MLQDLRFAFRSYLKTPGFVVVAVLALALGIGANTAMFSALDAVLLRQLPYRDPARLVMIWESNPLVGGFLAQRLPACLKDVLEWKRQSRLLDDLGYLQEAQVNLTGLDKPEQVQSVTASTNFLSLLGVQTMLGRGFTASDSPGKRGSVALISYAMFERKFAKDPGAIGKTIHVDEAPYTIIGVLPPEFHLPAMWEGFDQKKPDVWLTMSAAGMSDAELSGRQNFVFARLKDNVTLEQFRAEMASIDQRLIQLYPKLNTTFGVNVFPLFVEDVGAVMRRTIVVLQFAVAFVLLIACANVANLLLARAAGREKEIAIRIALGAGRWRLARQMLAESLLLSVFAGAAGVGLAFAGMQAIRKFAPEDNYHLHQLTLDAKVLVFTLGAALLTGLIFGLAPAIQTARQNVNESLSKGGRGGGSGVSGRLRNVLVISEVALALVLLAGAGLMIRSMASLLSISPGFRTDHLLTMHVNLNAPKYQDEKLVKEFCNELLDRVVDQLTSAKVVGWSQGRFEWGPRALGNRSIIADPRNPNMKDIVNAKIKFREPYRPFAPSVLAESAEKYFELPNAAHHCPARYMQYVVPVREKEQATLPAITHVDGTGRLQTVFKEQSPRYYKLIERFGQATGVPVILNTSFNLKGEPIVNTPANAFNTFSKSEMDALVLGNFIVDKQIA